MINIIKVSAFSLVVIGGFWGFSNFGIPQIKPALPPIEEKLDLGTLTMDEFIALGNKIFNGKGNCTLCHNTMGRAPMLDRIGTVSIDRLNDPLYKGEAKTVEEYLYESLTKPSAFVVSGYGKTGSDDTESPMPDVTGSGIGLNDTELAAVIAYLQDSGGAEVTVSFPEASHGNSEMPVAEQAPSLKTAEEVIAKYACGTCHTFAGQTGEIGPNLTSIGKTRNKDYLRQSILDPEETIAEGYKGGMMPVIYGDEMNAKELELLVNYLAGLK